MFQLFHFHTGEPIFITQDSPSLQSTYLLFELLVVERRTTEIEPKSLEQWPTTKDERARAVSDRALILFSSSLNGARGADWIVSIHLWRRGGGGGVTRWARRGRLSPLMSSRGRRTRT